jgi:hypothetical protein
MTLQTVHYATACTCTGGRCPLQTRTWWRPFEAMPKAVHTVSCAVHSPFIHTAALIDDQHLDATCTHRHSSAGGTRSSFQLLTAARLLARLPAKYPSSSICRGVTPQLHIQKKQKAPWHP